MALARHIVDFNILQNSHTCYAANHELIGVFGRWLPMALVLSSITQLLATQLEKTRAPTASRCPGGCGFLHQVVSGRVCWA